MSGNRKKNASRNILFGTILKIYQIAIPFIMRTIMMYTVGVEYLGLNSLFISVLQVLNLAELGVGSAMVFSMYRPIAEDDHFTICALMRLYKIYYRIIGAVILCVGIIMLPFIPKLINSEVPADMNIYYLYLLNLFATVLTYWLFAYKNSVLQAHQRNDIVSKVTIITDTFKYLLQGISLIVFNNYYYFVIVVLLSQIVNNLLTAVVAQKLFPCYVARGTLSKEQICVINGKIKDLFSSKLGATIVGSADTIVISAFLGLTVLAQYQNYFMIMNAIMSLFIIIHTSITAGVGNSMITKSVDQNYKEFKVFTLLITWISGICISCFAVLYQPFMKLWMGKDMLLSNGIVILFCIYFWVYELVMMISVYKDAGGVWHEDRFRPLISGIVNLILNLALVKFIGLYGILLSTVFSMIFISIPWIIKNVFNLIFKRSPYEYFKTLFLNTIKIIITTIISLCATLVVGGNEYLAFVEKGIICLIVSSLILWGLLKVDVNYPEAVSLLKNLLDILPFKKK